MKRWMLALALLLAPATPAAAHFVFVVPDPGGSTASVILSEDLAPDEDVDVTLISGLSLRIAGADGKDAPVALGKAAGHAYKVALPGGGRRVVRGSQVFGVRERAAGGGFLVAYHPRAILGDPFERPTKPAGETPAAEIVPVGRPGHVAFQVLSKGTPAVNVQVSLLLPDGNEEQVNTDAEGRTRVFTLSGRYGAWARVVEATAGEHDGKKYTEVRHYPSLVIDIGATEPKNEPRAASAAERAGGVVTITRPLPPMPERTSSFGAAVSDGWLYVYGGHTAPTHSYHTTAVSGLFHRIRLDDAGASKRWESLPAGPALQGMNLVAHNGRVLRIGGMAPRNREGAEADNHSVADCAAYDPAAERWSSLPPMPDPRSSHDVVAAGGKLYVVGGWQLCGANEDEKWPDAALVLDLNESTPKWKPFPQPFRRRALIAAVHDGKVYAIGGFDENDKPSLRVDIYDPAAGSWSTAPQLPGPSRNGFGPAACTLEGKLYVSVADGLLYRLDGAGWTRVASTTPRIVHRVIPFGRQLLVIGGADKGGNFDLIEAAAVGTSARTLAEAPVAASAAATESPAPASSRIPAAVR